MKQNKYVQPATTVLQLRPMTSLLQTSVTEVQGGVLDLGGDGTKDDSGQGPRVKDKGGYQDWEDWEDWEK